MWGSDLLARLHRSGFPTALLHTAKRDFLYFPPCLDILLISPVQMLSAGTLHYLTPTHWPIALLSAWPRQYHSPVSCPLHGCLCGCVCVRAHAWTVALFETEFGTGLHTSQVYAGWVKKKCFNTAVSIWGLQVCLTVETSNLLWKLIIYVNSKRHVVVALHAYFQVKFV